MNIIQNNAEHSGKALEALKEVLDPEIGLNIVDLGLVYELSFEEDGKKLLMLMTLTTQFCPMGDSIVTAASNVLQQQFPGWVVSVELRFDPPWEPARISAEGNKFLNR